MQLSNNKHATTEQQTRRISRKFARPVETILRVYNDPRTTLYQVLGVSPSVEEYALKKIYRHKALQVHPDKNPHPDAKEAFDALQDAFDTLFHQRKRDEYDEEIATKKRRRKITKKRAKKVTNLIDIHLHIDTDTDIHIGFAFIENCELFF